jgi:membrane associated rhomboid family serine protease
MITPFQYLPRVIRYLLIVNLALFLLILLADWQKIPLASLLAFHLPAVIYEGQIWRVVTYMFTHMDPMHFLFNMLGLWMFGDEVATQMGERRFLGFYLGTGVFAIVASGYFHPTVIGASGALYAVMFAYARYWPDRVIQLFFVFPVRMRNAIYIFAVIDFLMISRSGSPVAHLTHLCGFLGAFVYFRLWDKPSVLGGAWNAPKAGQVRVVDFSQPSQTPVQTGFPAQQPVEKPDFEYDEGKLDAILAKVSRVGLDNLAEHEKDYLIEASRVRRIRRGNHQE